MKVGDVMVGREHSCAVVAEAMETTPQGVSYTEGVALRKIRETVNEGDLEPEQDTWRSAAGFAPGCRQVGCERWPR